MKPVLPVVKTAANTARAAVRAGVVQTQETLKDVKEQAGLAPVEVPEVIQTIRNEGAENIDKEKIANTERAMLADLEARLARIRAENAKKLQSYKEEQQTAMDSQKISKPTESFEPPKGKIRKALGSAKKAIGSIISGRKQAESKMGSGKG